MPVDHGTCESVRSTIRSNETTTHKDSGKAINNLPAVRGGHADQFEPLPDMGSPMNGGGSK